ncbi:MAG: ABC transporter permease [Bryobacteraceae bacterium]|nr:ABC transporter permease [Bryobacteraceae bacterium]
MLHFTLILKNTLRNRRRTILTVLSIGASLSLLGVLMAIYKAFYLAEAPPEQALRLIVRNRISLAVPLPVSYMNQIRQLPGVRAVMISQWFNGVYKDSRDPNNFFARFAVEPEKLFVVRGEISIPEDQKRAFLAERTACIVGRPLAERLGFQLGDRITLKGDIFPVDLELTVRGIYEAPINSEALYFHQKYLEEGLPTGRQGQVGTFVILAESPELVSAIAAAVDEMFRNSTAQTRTESEQAFSLSFLAFLGNVKAFLFSIFAAVTFTMLLVAANTMAMSVRERVKEVGVLKTLGFTSGQVRGILLGEALAISLAGGLLGCLLAAGACALIRSGPLVFQQIRMLSLGPTAAVATIALATLIGLISAWIPATAAARIPVVESIRHAG